MVQAGILRQRAEGRRTQGSAPSTVPYSGGGSRRGTDSTVSYCSAGSAQARRLRSEGTASSVGGPGSTASTVPHALDYEPAAPPSEPAARRGPQGRPLSEEEEAMVRRAAAGVKAASGPPDEGRRATSAPGTSRPRAPDRGRRLATAHGGTRGGHEPLRSPASTVVYEECPACGNPEGAAGAKRDDRRGVAWMPDGPGAKAAGGAAAGGGKGAGAAEGRGERGGRVVKLLARELWEFDDKHVRLAKDLNKYMRGGKVEDPVSLAAYLQEKMGQLDFLEARQRDKDRIRCDAEAERRRKDQERCDREHEAREARAKQGAERELSKREKVAKLRDEEAKRAEEAVRRKREAEEERRVQQKKELVEKEDERIKLVDEASRAREIKRREAASRRQEREFREEVDKDSAKRGARVRVEERRRVLAERQDPQVVRADLGNPSLMAGHTKMIAPYAQQQRPMLARLNRWKHPADDFPGMTTARPLCDQEFVLVGERRRALRTHVDAGAHDRGQYVSRRWAAPR